MRAAGDEGDVVAGARQPRAVVAADRAGAEDGDAHRHVAPGTEPESIPILPSDAFAGPCSAFADGRLRLQAHAKMPASAAARSPSGAPLNRRDSLRRSQHGGPSDHLRCRRDRRRNADRRPDRRRAARRQRRAGRPHRHNAAVYTADRRGTMAEAVAIRGNQILRVGSDREIARLQRPQTIVVDAKGGAVVPGFNDAHVDFIGGGLRAAMADLRGAATGAEVLERIAAWSDANPDAAWVIGQRLVAGSIHRRPAHPPDARLGRQDRPALMYAADESDRLSGSTRRRCGSRTSRGRPPSPATARSSAKAARGEPTGVLRGGRGDSSIGAVPAPTPRAARGALRAAIAEATSTASPACRTRGRLRTEPRRCSTTPARSGKMTRPGLLRGRRRTRSDLADEADLRSLRRSFASSIRTTRCSRSARCQFTLDGSAAGAVGGAARALCRPSTTPASCWSIRTT